MIYKTTHLIWKININHYYLDSVTGKISYEFNWVLLSKHFNTDFFTQIKVEVAVWNVHLNL